MSEGIKANWFMAQNTDGTLADSHRQHQVLDYVLWTDQIFSTGMEPHPSGIKIVCIKK